MGDSLFSGSTSLYYGVSRVVENSGSLSFDYSVQGEAEPFPTEAKSHELSFELSLNDGNNPLGKWFLNERRRFVRQKKLLMWAVTHGYVVGIKCEKDGEEGWLCVDRPAPLRRIKRKLPFIPEFQIFDRQYRKMKVKRGKVYESKD